MATEGPWTTGSESSFPFRLGEARGIFPSGETEAQKGQPTFSTFLSKPVATQEMISTCPTSSFGPGLLAWPQHSGSPAPSSPHPCGALGHSLWPRGSPTVVKQDEGPQGHSQVGPAHACLTAEEESRGRPVGITERQQAGGFLGKTTTVSNSMTWKPSARTKSGEMGVMTSNHLCPAVFGKGCLDGGSATSGKLLSLICSTCPEEYSPASCPGPWGAQPAGPGSETAQR